MVKKKDKSFLEKIRTDFKKTILGAIILQGLFLMFGVIGLINPYMVFTSSGIVWGIYLIILGIYAIYEFIMRDEIPLFKNRIVMGVLAIIVGVLAIFNPFKLIKILTIALGIYLLVFGIIKLLEALKLKKYEYEAWNLMLVSSILMIIFGVFVTINPIDSMEIVELGAIFIILSSILEACNLIMIYGKARDFTKLFKEMKKEKKVIKKKK